MAAEVTVATRDGNVTIAAFQKGDVGGDGKIDIFDLLDLLRVLSGKAEAPNADVDGDGKTDIYDLLELLRVIKGSSSLAASGGTAEGSYQRLKYSLSEKYEITFPDGSVMRFARDARTLKEIRATEGTAADLLDNRAGAYLPKAYALSQNKPNPFNPSTMISYAVPEGSQDQVTLKVYDLRGRLVRTLVDKVVGAGSYSVLWDGADENGRKVSSGVYLYRLKAGAFIQTRKMVLLK